MPDSLGDKNKVVSRRSLLQMLAWTGVGHALEAGKLPVARNSARDNADYPPAFVEIPPSASAIRWTHSNGRSAEMFLPETTGAGCAFLDYDNDGWMDIYLVNSGKCDFFDPNPPLRNALYRNNRDGTFTDVTE